MTKESEHGVEVRYIAHRRHRPVCKCGWVGLARPSESEAYYDGQDHVVKKSTPP